MLVDVGARDLASGADGSPHPHRGRRGVDGVVLLDVLEEQGRGIARIDPLRGEPVGTVLVELTGDVTILLLHEELCAEQLELAGEPADVGGGVDRRPHEEGVAARNEEGRHAVPVLLIEAIARDERRGIGETDAKIDRAVAALRVEVVQVVDSHVARHGFLEELRDLVEIGRPHPGRAQIVAPRVAGREAKVRTGSSWGVSTSRWNRSTHSASWSVARPDG